MRALPFVAAFGLMAVLSASAAAQSLGGISVGESTRSAIVKLGQQGTVKCNDKAASCMAGDYVIGTCNGRVRLVSRKVGVSFGTLMRIGALAEQKYGKVGETDVDYFGAQYEAGNVTLNWHLPANVTYSINANGLSGQVIAVAESFRWTVPTICQ